MIDITRAIRVVVQHRPLNANKNVVTTVTIKAELDILCTSIEQKRSGGRILLFIMSTGPVQVSVTLHKHGWSHSNRRRGMIS